MMSATECRKQTDEILTERDKKKAEWLECRKKATQEYCNTVLSSELNFASKQGEHYYEIDLMNNSHYLFPKEPNHELLEFRNSYWRHTWKDVDMELIKHIAELHGYTVKITKAEYKKGPNKYWQGICMRISW